jgi:antitoxin FitA
MASLHVRNLDEDLVRRLKERAARHGRSAEAEHREILREALFGTDNHRNQKFLELAAEIRKLSAGRAQTPSQVLQREGRDER